MDFTWYTELYSSNEITQGDILTNCTLPIPNVSIYEAIIQEKEEVDEPIDIKSANLIVLSQACDILNEKIDSIVLCPIWSLDVVIKENEYYKGNKARESLRQGKEPSYHLLQKYESENINMDYSVVDFHQIYTLPKGYLKKIAYALKYRIRLSPPYREHLSQAFARYFMRVGLPLDISKSEIKNYSENIAT